MGDFIRDFLRMNPQVDQSLKITPLFEGRYFKFAKARKHVGWYRYPEITIFPSLCTKKGTGYSWPGHISDRTECGVLAHELGHHCHLSRPDREWIRQNFPRKGRVTGYEPNIDESFAESFRLFVLNPDLLMQGRMERYEFIISLGFERTIYKPYTEVLKGMRSHMWSRIVPWITRGGS